MTEIFDGAEVRFVPPEQPKPPQDWEMLVSEGHVLGHRIRKVGLKWYGPAIGLALVAGYLAFKAVSVGSGGGVTLPEPWVQRLTYDSAHYVTVPGADQKYDYRLAFLSDIRADKGLSQKEWSDLVAAVIADVRAHGAKVDDYEAIPKLPSQPVTTHTDSALSKHADDLSKGLVLLPSRPATNGPALEVAGMVEGAFSFAAVMSTGQCGTAFGPAVSGCGRYSPTPGSNVIGDALLTLDPANSKEGK